MGGAPLWAAWLRRAGEIVLELMGMLKPRWMFHSREKCPLLPLVGQSKRSCERQGKEGLQARPEFRGKPLWLGETFLVKPWSKKEQSQGQHTPASRAKRSKDSLTWAVKN